MNRGAEIRKLLVRYAIGFVMNFAGGLVLARWLGPAAWGVYSIVYVAQLGVQALLERGTAGYVIRRPSDLRPGELTTLLLLLLLIGGAFAAACFALSGAAADAIGAPGLAILLPALALSLPLIATRGVLLGGLERKLQYTAVAVIETVEIATFNAVAIVGTLFGATYFALAAALLLRFLVSTAVALRLTPTTTGQPARIDVYQLAITGAPFAASSFVWWTNSAAVPVILGRAADLSDIGIVYMAFTLMTYSQSIMAVVARVALPAYAMSARQAGDLPSQVASDVRRAMRYAGGFMLLFAVSSAFWVAPLFGPAWTGMSAIMLAIAPAYAISAALTPVIAALNARGNALGVLLITVAFALVYWPLSILLVDRVGARGLPLGYAVATPVILLFIALFQRVVGGLLLRPGPAELLAFAVVLLVSTVADSPLLTGAAILAIAGYLLWRLREDVGRTAIERGPRGAT